MALVQLLNQAPSFSPSQADTESVGAALPFLHQTFTSQITSAAGMGLPAAGCRGLRGRDAVSVRHRRHRRRPWRQDFLRAG